MFSVQRKQFAYDMNNFAESHTALSQNPAEYFMDRGANHGEKVNRALHVYMPPCVGLHQALFPPNSAAPSISKRPCYF